MEWLLALGVIAAAVAVAKKATPTSSSSPPPATTGNTPPPSAAPPPAQLAPGVYPPATPGAVPVQVMCQGGCSQLAPNGLLTASPGGTTDSSTVFWYAPGTKVLFTARVNPAGGPTPFIAFDHFEGPGVSTRQNPFAATITGPGYVRAVFACLGIPGF